MKAGSRLLRKRIGALIRELRRARGWTQIDLSEKLRQSGFDRCKRSLLSQIEAGTASVRSEEIYHLREVFGKGFELDFWNPYYNRAVGEIQPTDFSQ